ncbi:hypothetical protein PENSPDRAFT_755304 [Peniophora sp. CONT]|nr:hypothetical protein PENSPDRAFT_755304 [Peniophora sp. CONT]
MGRSTKKSPASAARPSIDSDPQGWERSWQAELDRTYASHVSRLPSILPNFRNVPRSTLASILDENEQQRQALDHKRLVELQDDIRTMCAQKSAEDDFPALWKAAGEEVRFKHYLTAMERVCEIPDMEKQRRTAPEVSWKVFKAKDGQGYLDVLLQLSREHPPRQYIYFHQRLVDSCLGISEPWDTSHSYIQDCAKFYQRGLAMRRMLFISLIVWNVMLSYYGRAETYVSQALQRERGLSSDMRAAGKAFGLSDAEMRATEKETKKTHKEQGHSLCTGCGKYDFQLPEDFKFKSCARCNTIGRTILYCSKECQLSDWKRGDPPHKTICGKPLAETAQQVSQASQGSGTKTRFPPAEAGFVRSPALLYTLNALEENRELDYVFVRPSHEDNDVGIRASVDNAMGQMFFALTLQRAVTTGDRASVQMLYEALKVSAETPGPGNIGAAALRKQLKNEYGVDVQDSA